MKSFLQTRWLVFCKHQIIIPERGPVSHTEGWTHFLWFIRSLWLSLGPEWSDINLFLQLRDPHLIEQCKTRPVQGKQKGQPALRGNAGKHHAWSKLVRLLWNIRKNSSHRWFDCKREDAHLQWKDQTGTTRPRDKLGITNIGRSQDYLQSIPDTNF